MSGRKGKHSMGMKLFLSWKKLSFLFSKSAQLILQPFFWLIFVILLTACGTVPPEQPISTTPTSAPTFTLMPPTATISPTLTFFQTLAPPSPTTLPAVLPKFPLDGYVMAFIKDGDLYFQDGTNSAVKLTHIGEKSYYPKLSDDNRKVIFSRDDGNLYSINTDGTQEQIIIRNDWLASFEPGTNMSILGFVSATHPLLVETYFCEAQKFKSPCSTSLFLANTDTGIIEKLVDLGLAFQQNSISRNIEVSPDGKMVAFGTMQGVGIMTIEGKLVRNNILPYKPSTSTVLFPSLYWLPDSSGLIVALPNTIYHSDAYDDLPASTIWQYAIGNNKTIQLLFDPPPMLDTFQVSPDGKWIVYGAIGNADTDVRLGNLANGHVQVVGQAVQSLFSWSPNSQYFIATSAGSVLGDVYSSPLMTICHLQGNWIDARHFLCWNTEGTESRLRVAEIVVAGVKIYDLGFGKDVEDSLYIKHK